MRIYNVIIKIKSPCRTSATFTVDFLPLVWNWKYGTQKNTNVKIQELRLIVCPWTMPIAPLAPLWWKWDTLTFSWREARGSFLFSPQKAQKKNHKIEQHGKKSMRNVSYNNLYKSSRDLIASVRTTVVCPLAWNDNSLSLNHTIQHLLRLVVAASKGQFNLWRFFFSAISINRCLQYPMKIPLLKWHPQRRKKFQPQKVKPMKM